MADPSVLAAVCAAGGTAVGALITGLLGIARQKVVIQVGDRRIEVEGPYAIAKIKEVLEILPLIQTNMVIMMK